MFREKGDSIKNRDGINFVIWARSDMQQDRLFGPKHQKIQDAVFHMVRDDIISGSRNVDKKFILKIAVCVKKMSADGKTVSSRTDARRTSPKIQIRGV